jgi:hypothetical protein
LADTCQFASDLSSGASTLAIRSLCLRSDRYIIEESESEAAMAEKNTRKATGEHPIPEEVREHIRAAHTEIGEGLRSFLPPEVMEHGRKAHKEMLLAWRSMIDAAIGRLDDSGN